MGTRSHIGIKNEDGTVLSVYCHWDGYLSNNGRLLLDNYNTEDAVLELLSFGDMSSLAAKISPSVDTHSFDAPEEGVCVFYGRDRGESGVEARVFENESEFLKKCQEDYTYLFVNGTWMYRSWNDPLAVLDNEAITAD